MNKFHAFIIMFFLTIAAESQEHKPALLPEPANWVFERFELPPGFASTIPYKGVEELRFAPGFYKKDTATYFTYAFVAQLDDVTAISQADIKDYLLKYYKGLCAVVARDRKLVIDTTQITATVNEKKDKSSTEMIYDASVSLFGVFTDGAALKLNIEVKVIINAITRKTYLAILASPREKADPVWKKLCEVREGFKIPK